ncbi:LysR family transcriptional regulator [Pseudomonas capeferrum]|uniref:LysR family transcriptional regulator n=1 Tax=Pseudomonas capeferrum TaxID=1495066 RepID=UPI0015E2E7E2|nr:LysR family transcriptional regulator [Pseudomonas capeferrum]MBA1200295.1 LysR family transcriptional regulator [Pseudomonas capeferrum]
MGLTLRQLDIFRAIAQHGSTTSASVALALSQSATSAALHELEGALDVRLFDRVGKRLVLNDNGQTLLPQAIRLLEAAAQIEDGFQRSDIVARLRVGCSTTIGNYIMPVLVEMLSKRAAGLQVDVFMGNSADIARQAAQLSIDIGLIEGPCHLPELTARPWFEDELVIVAAATDPLARKAAVTLDDLRDAPWLVRECGSGTAEQVLHLLLPYLGRWRNTRQIGSSEAIKRMVAAGIGISCLSYWVVDDLIAAGQLVVLNHDIPPLKRQLYAVHHRDKFISRALGEFQGTLEAFVATKSHC